MKKNELIRKAMTKGVVTFKYQKKDGSIREAKGTINSEIIGSVYSSKGSFGGGFSPSDYGYKSYWDVECKGWRCYDPDKLISAEGIF